MQGGEDLSIKELNSNLSTYKDQLHQVKQLLIDEPGNSEYADMEKELEEVIELTEELLATAKQNEHSGLVAQPDAVVSPGQEPFGGTSHFNTGSSSHDGFSVGTKVQAVFSEDGEWYDATIEAITPNGYYVSYNGWGNKEEVDPGNVRPIQEGEINPLLEAEREAEATKQAIKRKIAQAGVSDLQSRSLPAKLLIDPNDPEDVVGFFSGRKRESIFKSPDDPHGKVGVTNSGKGLTDFQRREKYLQLKGANMDNEDQE